MNGRKLYRSNNKKILGVCSGIAEYFNIDPTIIRVIYVVLLFVTAIVPCVVLYFVLALVMPEPPASDYQYNTYNNNSNNNQQQ